MTSTQLIAPPERLDLAAWEKRYAQLLAEGLAAPLYGGPLERHATEGGDRRLCHLTFDNSIAALRLWNFVLSEEARLATHRANGWRIIGAMKDLGTLPVMVFALPRAAAFYVDGAWWTPCLMEHDDQLLERADKIGLGGDLCPARALAGAFVVHDRFPIPDALFCSVGATCDDLPVIARRVEDLGYPIHWWEMPHRRVPDADEEAVELPGGFVAARTQVVFVRDQLLAVARRLEALTGAPLGAQELDAGIRRANVVRRLIQRLRTKIHTAPCCPLPALETLLAEMLSIHFCSDYDECGRVLAGVEAEVDRRIKEGVGFNGTNAVRVFWINPVADLRAMNVLEECGARVCGSELMFQHAFDPIPETGDPFEACAKLALADPMVGSCGDRARLIAREARRSASECLVLSRIPGASHCPWESLLLREQLARETNLPLLEIEVPGLADAYLPALRTRLEAFIEQVRDRRPMRTEAYSETAEERP